jgi:3-oxoacyl-[acyl-carrier-protein] synthase II
MTSETQRFVVTGLGAVSAWGWGVDPLWAGLLSGRTAIGPLRRFAGEGHRTGVAAEVPAAPEALARHLAGWDELSLAERFALAAAEEAMAAAGGASEVLAGRPEAVGVFFGGSTAGMLESEDTLAEGSGRLGRAAIRLLAAQPLDAPAAAVARSLGLAGPVLTISSACASSTQALGAALDALRAGEVDVALAGGADSLCRLTYAGFNALRVVDERACRPFREGRAGMTLGEGAGVLVVEPEERARARGAKVLGAVLGAGNSCDAHHMTAPHPEGLGAALAIERALRDAGLDPARSPLAFVNAHGTGTPLNDLSEWRGMARAFGDRAGAVPLTATKASVGHLLGSSGAIEAVATLLCLAAGVVHPTPRSGDPGERVDPETPARLVLGEPLPLEPGAGAGAATVALSTSFGFGGANAAAVFSGAGR